MAKLLGSKSCVLILPLAMVLACPSAAASEHNVSAHLGVPVPLVVYGASSGPGGGDGLKFLSTAQLEYDHRIYRALFVGGWGGSGLLVSNNSLGSLLNLSSAGAQVIWRPAEGNESGYELSTSVGLGALFTYIRVDDNISKNTLSLGARVVMRIERALTPAWNAGVALGMESYLPPLGHALWFNQRLGMTSLLTVAIVVRWNSRS